MGAAINMDTKCKAKINKLGEMISALLMKVVENKELYGDVYKLREKHDAICSLIKKDKLRAAKYENYEKKLGLPSYLLIIFIIILANANTNPEHTAGMLGWMTFK